MSNQDFFLTISKAKQKLTGLSIANDNGDVSQGTDTKPVKKRFTIKNDTGAVLSVTKNRSYRKAIKTNVSPIAISKANLQLNDIECGNKKSAAENNDLLHQVLVSVDLVSINHDVSRSSFMYSCSQLGEIDQNVSLMQKLR